MYRVRPRVPKHRAAALAACYLFAVACGRQQEFEPLVEEVSIRNLQAETEAALAHLRAARDRLPERHGEAADELAASERALTRLLDYYLPLVEARELAYSAYRLNALGDRHRAGRDLASIEEILLAMAGKGAQLETAVEQPLALTTESRAAIAAARDDVPHLLLNLANRLNLMILKGPLELQAHRP